MFRNIKHCYLSPGPNVYSQTKLEPVPIVINIDENGEGDDPSSYEEEADTVLEREESDKDPDEVEELRVDSNIENHRDDDEGDY